MNTALNKSLCVFRTLIKHKPKWTTQSLTFSKDGLQHGKHYNFCRRLTTAPTTDEVKEEALATIRARLSHGIGTKESVDGYSKIAKEYDELVKRADFSAPKRMAATAASILKDNKSARILDAGAGSGLGGAELHKLGYTNVDAVDASSGLLEVAKEKNIYNKIMCQFLGSEHLPVEDGTYDMVTLSGAMGENLLPSEAIDDLIRVVKPGGHVVNIFRAAALNVPWYGEDLESHFQKLEKMGKWKQLEKSNFPNFLHSVPGVIFVHQII